MNENSLNQILSDSFTPGERTFLLGDPNFRDVVSMGSDDAAGVRMLNRAGLELLVAAGYVPSRKARKALRYI